MSVRFYNAKKFTKKDASIGCWLKITQKLYVKINKSNCKIFSPVITSKVSFHFFLLVLPKQASTLLFHIKKNIKTYLNEQLKL